ncbi:response regulator transcription factor [Intrasporangium mesophilum]
MQPATRVVVVDARQGFLDAVALVLAEEDGIDLVGAARTVRDALERHLTRECDVIAVGLGGDNCVEHLGALKDDTPELGIVVIAGPGDEERLGDALELGARGWVSRSDGVNELVAAMLDVGDGVTHLPAEPLHALFAASLARRPPLATLATPALTQRESDVLSCLAAGMSRHDIGVALELSDNTVRTYVRRILRKMHVHSAPAAVVLARSGGEQDE